MGLLRNTYSKYRISEAVFQGDEIFEVTILKDEEFEEKDVKELIRKAGEIGNERKLKHLYLFGARTVPSKDARELLCSEYGSIFKSKQAYVVTSLSQKMIFNFMVNVEKPKVTTMIFTSREKALTWLQD